MDRLDLKLFNECFTYDTTEYKLIWKVRPLSHFSTEGQWRLFNKRFPGKEAGYVKKDGKTSYRLVKINGITIAAHRVIYCILHSTTDIEEIDHIDGNGLNNSPSNLRSVSRHVNSMNQRLSERNKTGICGVCWCESFSMFCATYRDNGKPKYVKFDNLFDAACWRKSYELGQPFGKNHGNTND